MLTCFWTIFMATAAAADPIGELSTLRAQGQATVLVATVGPEADKRTRRALEQQPDLAQGVVLVRVPTAGDADREMSRVLDEHGIACGLRVAWGAEGWTIDRYGDCTASASSTSAGVTGTAAGLPSTAAAILSELMAMPDHATRRALLTAKLGNTSLSADDSAKLGQALAVVVALESRGDDTQTEGYLAAALCDDATVRAQATQAAATGAPPPAVPASAAPTTTMGTVCIARTFNVLGSGVTVPIVINGRPLPSLRTASAVAGDFEAGEVVVELGAQGMGGTRVTADLAAGSTLYYRFRSTLGGLALEPTDATEVGDLCARARRE